MNPSRRIALGLSVLLVVLAGYNILLHFAARTSQRHRMLSRLEHLSPQTDCLFVGDSLTQAGVDVEAFESAWAESNSAVHASNIALGATYPVEHCLILSEALRRPLHLRFVIYGVFDDKLTINGSGRFGDLVGNRAFCYYSPEQAAAILSPGSALKRWELGLLGRIPMVSERSSLWGKVEMVLRSCEEIGMPRRKTNRFGRVEDFAALEARDVASFTNRCNAIVREGRGFSTAVREIIGLAAAHGARVILVEMPMTTTHRNRFYSTRSWKELRSYLEGLALREGATYMDASDWVPDDRDFEDVMHLNAEGAQLFSARLGRAVGRN